MIRKSPRSGEKLSIFLLLGALILLSDSILNYPLRLQGSPGAPWSIFTIPFLAIYLSANKTIKPLERTFILFIVMAICILLSIFLPENEREYSIQLPLSVSSFLLGVCIASNERIFKKIIIVIIISLFIQAVVAFLFLIRALPIIPGEVHLFSVFGDLYERLAYTTDQNYQVIYWVLAPTLFLFRSNLIRFLGFVFCVIFLFALVDLGTRSGLLVFSLSGVMAALVVLRRAFRSGTMVREFSILIVGVVILIVVALSTDLLSTYNDELGKRWAILNLRHDSSDGQSNITQRLESLLFFGRVFFQSIFPTGLREFIEFSGTVPHSSPTTLLLLYGWFGVALWMVWLGYPATLAAFRLVGSKCTRHEEVIFIGFLCTIVAILALPSPFTKLIWMFAGIVSVRTSPDIMTSKVLK